MFKVGDTGLTRAGDEYEIVDSDGDQTWPVWARINGEIQIYSDDGCFFRHKGASFYDLMPPTGHVERSTESETHQISATTQALIDLLIERDRAGLAKYGTTLDRSDLSRSDWLQHLAEELLDGAGYALAAKRTA